MRKALLFIKVALLLVTFVGTSSSHASKSGGHNLLAVSAFDACINHGQQNTTEDDKAIITDLELPPVVVYISSATFWELSTLVERINRAHSARAPPVHTLV
jgi:hypothetical protein